MRYVTAATFLALSAASGLHAAAGGELDVRTTGYFIWDAGYIHAAQNAAGETFESEPFGGIIGGLVLTAKPSDRLSFVINPELKSFYAFPRQPGARAGETAQKARWDVYMEEAKSRWVLGAVERPWGDAELGYMVYKENRDARIFGDYLFRSMIYPGLVFTRFNYPRAQIFGLRVGNAPGKGFRHDLFLLNEIKNYPLFDFSLAYAASWSLGNLLEVGAGVNFRSLVPVRPSLTTPHGGTRLKDNTYKTISEQSGTVIRDSAGGILKTVTIRRVPGTETTDVIVATPDGLVDSLRVNGIGVNGLTEGELGNPAMKEMVDRTNHIYPELGGTETPYSFSGTLVMGRLSLNPLGALGTNPLGRDALKIFIEAAVLGWKDYPGYYENRRERMPVMAGINLPTFGFLETLVLEGEYYPSTHLPTQYYRSRFNLPQPGGDFSQANWDEARRKKDDWKWGLAIRKDVMGIALVAQAGTDHTKMKDDTNQDDHDIMTRPGHWYFQLRFIGGAY